MIIHKKTFKVNHATKGFLKPGDTFIFDPGLDEPLIDLYQGDLHLSEAAKHLRETPQQPWQIEVSYKTDKGPLNLRITEHLDPIGEGIAIYGLAFLDGKPPQVWSAAE